MRHFILAVTLFLVSCAGVETKKTEIVARAPVGEVQRIPVSVPCLTKEQIPKPPATWMNPARTGWQNEVAAAIDLKEADEYMVRSQSLMWGCVKSFEEEKKP